MPEGPEIKKAADRLAKAVSLKPLTEVFFAFEHLKPYENALASSMVTSIKPRGKALLTTFTNELVVYTHNQLYGRWQICKAYNYPNTGRSLRFALHTEKKSALLYSASDIEVLEPQELDSHPFLSKLGPDILDEATTSPLVLERLRSKTYCRRQLGSLLLDQGFVAGLGNYLRCEILFLAGIHPRKRAIDLTQLQQEELARLIIAITRQSYETGGITNDLERVGLLKRQGLSRGAYRHHIFHRIGRQCYQCDEKILKTTFASRPCYICPICQPAN